MTNELRAIARVAERLGLRVDPIVLRDYATLLVHLSPEPIVARVSRLIGGVRGAAHAAREVALGEFLRERGAPIVGPTTRVPPGPYEEDGVRLSLWELVVPVDAPVDGGWAGKSLRALHEQLARYDGDLPRFEPWDEVESLLRLQEESEDVEFLRALAASLRARLDRRELRVQPVHGDAHLGNVIPTRSGPLWTDWEIACLGPVEWDLACLVSRKVEYDEEHPEVDAALAAYGAHDAELLRRLEPLRLLFVTAWTLELARRRPDVRAYAQRRIERLRRVAPP